MNHSVSFGERLREERQRLGLSQTALGSAAGVTKKTQILYESGERSPDGVYLTLVSETGADVLYILTGTRSSAAPVLRVEQERAGYSVEVLSAEEQALLDNYRHCPPEGQVAIKTTTAAFAQSVKGVKKGKAA